MNLLFDIYFWSKFKSEKTLKQTTYFAWRGEKSYHLTLEESIWGESIPMSLAFNKVFFFPKCFALKYQTL